MIEIRELTKEEVLQLVSEAEDKETRNLIYDPYTHFKRHAVDASGLVVDGKPVYMAYLVKDRVGYDLWTTVNRNVKHQFTLYKNAKKILNKWYSKYKEIYSTMENIEENNKNIEWTKRLGFKPVHQNDEFITLKMEV